MLDLIAICEFVTAACVGFIAVIFYGLQRQTSRRIFRPVRWRALEQKQLVPQYCGKLRSISRVHALMPPRRLFTRNPADFISRAAIMSQRFDELGQKVYRLPRN